MSNESTYLLLVTDVKLWNFVYEDNICFFSLNEWVMKVQFPISNKWMIIGLWNYIGIVLLWFVCFTQKVHISGGLFREMDYGSQHIRKVCNRRRSPVVPVAAVGDGPDHQSASVNQSVKYSKKLLWVFVPISVVYEWCWWWLPSTPRFGRRHIWHWPSPSIFSTYFVNRRVAIN